MTGDEVPSGKQIDRAGARLRDWYFGEDLPEDDLVRCFDIVADFRASFRYPLRKATVGLRQFVERESEARPIEVAQRLKRIPTILDKLNRQPTMKITRMQDIGGCRTIVTNRAEVYAVLGRIEKRWDVKSLKDYIENPRATGYRAVHVTVVRDERLIEIQLRTPLQHEWATTVDKHSGRLRHRLGFNLKDGEGPAELLSYFEYAARGMALQEEGQEVDETFVTEFDALREQVGPFFA